MRNYTEGPGVSSRELEGLCSSEAWGHAMEVPRALLGKWRVCNGESGGISAGEVGVCSRAVAVPERWPPRRGALTCFPAAAAKDFCRNCRSRGSDGAAETVPRARAMVIRARAHWRRHDSISPAGRARRGGGGSALAAPLRLGSGVGDLLASRRLYKPFS